MIAIEKNHTNKRCSGLLACGFAMLTGCQSLAGPLDVGGPLDADGPNPVSQAAAQDDGSGTVEQVSGELTFTEKAKKNSARVMNFVSGREQENVPRAKQLYQEADALFRSASSESEQQPKSKFAKAAKTSTWKVTDLSSAAMMLEEKFYCINRLTDVKPVVYPPYILLSDNYLPMINNENLKRRLKNVFVLAHWRPKEEVGGT